MATENLDCIYSLLAGADLSAKTGFAVVVNTSGVVVLAGVGAVPHGHLHNAPVSGAPARFVHNGKVVKAVLGTGGATLGARLSVLAAGSYGISATTGHAYVGIALRAGAAGDVIEMLMIPNLGAVA